MKSRSTLSGAAEPCTGRGPRWCRGCPPRGCRRRRRAMSTRGEQRLGSVWWRGTRASVGAWPATGNPSRRERPLGSRACVEPPARGGAVFDAAHSACAAHGAGAHDAVPEERDEAEMSQRAQRHGAGYQLGPRFQLERNRERFARKRLYVACPNPLRRPSRLVSVRFGGTLRRALHEGPTGFQNRCLVAAHRTEPEPRSTAEEPVLLRGRPDLLARPSRSTAEEPVLLRGRPDLLARPSRLTAEEPVLLLRRPELLGQPSRSTAEEPDLLRGSPDLLARPSRSTAEEPVLLLRRPELLGQPSRLTAEEPDLLRGRPDLPARPSRFDRRGARPPPQSTRPPRPSTALTRRGARPPSPSTRAPRPATAHPTRSPTATATPTNLVRGSRLNGTASGSPVSGCMWLARTRYDGLLASSGPRVQAARGKAAALWDVSRRFGRPPTPRDDSRRRTGRPPTP